MVTCATCGAEVVSGSAHDFACPGTGPARGPAPAPTPGFAPATPPPGGTGPAWAPPPSDVDSFEGGLTPFLGDPNASHLLGKLVQVGAGLLAAYGVVRAAAWGDIAVLARDPARVAGSIAEQQRILDARHLVDTIEVLWWPTIIAFLVVFTLWRRARRPQSRLQADGEAYVEATLTRVLSTRMRLGATALFVAGFLITLPTLSSKTLLPTQVAGHATGRAVSALLFALGWSTFIAWVWLSERHLARRVAKAQDPALAGYSVPYVTPEKETGSLATLDESAWTAELLRTAGLCFAGAGAFFGFVIGLNRLGSQPLLGGALLVGSAIVAAFVGWAYVGRLRRARARRAAWAERQASRR